MKIQDVVRVMHGIVRDFGEDYAPEEDDAGQYVLDGKPSCIVALILSRFGASTELLHGSGAYGNGTAIRYRHDLIELFGIDQFTVRMLTIAQDMQDEGQSWGAALREIEGHVG